MVDFAWLVPLLPLLCAVWIAATIVLDRQRGDGGERVVAGLALGSSLLSLLMLLVLDGIALVSGAPGHRVYGQWLGSGDLSVDFSLMLDPLGLSMSTLVAVISLMALRFSVDYMHRESGFRRFFMLMSLFQGAMLLLVMAGNGVMTFVGWELVGLSSYLLIGYSYWRETAVSNATRAFVSNRVGDAGFLLAISLSFYWLDSVEWPHLIESSGSLETLTAGLMGLGFLIAAMAKSAQVPFSPWISRALEGPTPSSALFYGAVMVHAGVYLVIRLEALFVQAPVLLVLMGLVGLLTALYGWLGGLVQTDVKSALMFSTTAQVGLMFLECGLGWFELASWHLAANAFWRSYQFLHAPSMLQLLKRPVRQAPAWLRKRPALYTAAIQRFWLDPVADWLLLRPTRSLAQDVQDFDQRVINRIVGLPGHSETLNSLAKWEERKRGRRKSSSEVGQARGMAGRTMEWLATLFHWFEERLVLQGGGEGLKRALDVLGVYLRNIEHLLGQPRYLLLMIMATFVVII